MMHGYGCTGRLRYSGGGGKPPIPPGYGSPKRADGGVTPPPLLMRSEHTTLYTFTYTRDSVIDTRVSAPNDHICRWRSGGAPSRGSRVPVASRGSQPRYLTPRGRPRHQTRQCNRESTLQSVRAITLPPLRHLAHLLTQRYCMQTTCKLPSYGTRKSDSRLSPSLALAVQLRCCGPHQS